MGSDNRIIGVISDTHGLLRPEALQVFKGVSLILHAGDIGDADVLAALRIVAPVIAVRGNNDKGDWANCLPETETINLGAVSIYLLHDLKTMKRQSKANVDVVVSGHSHRPSIDRRGGLLFLNPGSAGPRRFKLPISAALLTIQGKNLHPELIDLNKVTQLSKASGERLPV